MAKYDRLDLGRVDRQIHLYLIYRQQLSGMKVLYKLSWIKCLISKKGKNMTQIKFVYEAGL